MSEESVNSPAAATETATSAAPADGMAAALAMLTARPAEEAPASPPAAVEAPKVIQGAPPPAAAPADPMAALTAQVAALQAHIAKLSAPPAAPKAPEAPSLSPAELAELQEWRQLKDVSAYDFNKVLEKLGRTPDDIARMAVNNGKLSPEQMRMQALEKKLADLESRDSERVRAAQTAQQRAAEQAFVENLRRQHNESTEHDLVKSLGDDSLMTIKGVIENHFVKTRAETGTGVELTYKQAADIVEQHLENQLEKNLAQSKKFQSKWAKIEAKKAAETPATLTGNMAGGTKPTEAYNPEDAYRKALAMLRKT